MWWNGKYQHCPASPLVASVALQAASKKNKTGLSAMAESTLGRPLNKGMQVYYL